LNQLTFWGSGQLLDCQKQGFI